MMELPGLEIIPNISIAHNIDGMREFAKFDVLRAEWVAYWKTIIDGRDCVIGKCLPDGYLGGIYQFVIDQRPKVLLSFMEKIVPIKRLG